MKRTGQQKQILMEQETAPVQTIRKGDTHAMAPPLQGGSRDSSLATLRPLYYTKPRGRIRFARFAHAAVTEAAAL
jgi:hypothetical protein